MSTSFSNQPVEVRVTANAPTGDAGSTGADNAASVASVAVIVVTWNRKKDVDNIVRSLSRQLFPRDRMHVIVVDNASTDGTLDFLASNWRPERIVENLTDQAHEPRFQPTRPRPDNSPNAAGFASFTIVRNIANMGGCGGFNTGFAYISHALARPDAPEAHPTFAWLVDDDADVPPSALVELTKAAASDPNIGLVGSRTVDISNKRTTIETTIYLNRTDGVMADEPTPNHPQRASHEQWIRQVGGTRGEHPYTGIRDVDVVSACSMLARWSAVEKVGFWDWRYFIYCDDADWCLRFGKAGYRVVLSLDAIVHHTPWNLKLTVGRLYYAQRNLMWMLQKVLPPRELRAIMRRRMYSTLRDSLRAGLHRRLFHAEVIRRTADDMITQRTGKLDNDGPTPEPIIDSLRRAGVLRSSKRIAILCAAHPSIAWADGFRQYVSNNLNRAAGEELPQWTYVVRNDVPDHGGSHEPAETRPYRLVYGPRRRARLRRQLRILTQRPSLIVVFDQTTDFPALLGEWNLHVDTRKLTMGQLERDGTRARARFLSRWTVTAMRGIFFALTVKPYHSPTKYG